MAVVSSTKLEARSAAMPVVLGFVSLAAACNWFEESKYSNCAIATRASSFIGEKLRNDGDAVVSRQLTAECMKRDRDIDGSDGEDRGRVRWVVCPKGPDCDEAGMF